MRRGDAADVLVVLGWVLLGLTVVAAFGWLGLLGYVGGTCLVVGGVMAWAEAARSR